MNISFTSKCYILPNTEVSTAKYHGKNYAKSPTSSGLPSFAHVFPVRQIRVKIALNVVKASKWVRMKLITSRSKLGLGTFWKFLLLLVHQYGCRRQKHFTEEENSLKGFYLTSRIKRNGWKELTKLIQNGLGTILKGWIVAEIFDLENTPKLLTVSIFWHFCEIQNAIPQWGSPRSSWFMSHFESVFRALFSCGIYIVNKQDSKNMFLRNFDFMVKSLHRIAVLEYLKSISSFEMAPTL